MSERIAVTGIGVISPIGCDLDTFVAAILAGQGNISRSARLEDTPYRARHVGLVTGFPHAARSAGLDRHLQLALAAAEQALDHAGLELDPDRRRRTGLVLGTCNGGMLSIERHYRAIHAAPGAAPEEELPADLFLAKRYFSAAVTLAQRFRLAGPCTSVVTACAASANAIGLGRDWLLEGRADTVLVGGADAFSVTTLAGFDRLQTTSAERCAPFSEPTGLNLGEGAGFWVLEPESRARARGAAIHGYVLGYGLSCDAHHATAPDPSGEGLGLAVRRALDDAAAPLDSIHYVNAHGTGTEANDRAESRVLERLFREVDGGAPPVSSSKSFFGHTLGAAGILEATVGLLGLRAGVLPPTLQFREPRPGCQLDYVPNSARPTTATRFITQNAAFGGNNCCLVVGTPDDPAVTASARDVAPVVITGLGLVSPVGAGAARHADALAAGRSGIAPVTRFDVAGCRNDRAALVEDLGDPRLVRRLGLPGMDRSSRYATVAAHQALTGAGLRLRPRTSREVGLLLGLTMGPTRGEMEYLRSLYTEGVPNLVHFPYLVLNSVAGNVSRALALKGTSSTLCSGPGSGLESVVWGVSAVGLGHAGILLAGGVDEVTERVHRDFDELEPQLGADPAPGAGAPPTLGEGSVLFLLESRAHAAERGAPVLAEVLAAQSGFDPVCLGGNERDSSLLGLFLEELLKRSGVRPQQISSVSLGAASPSCVAAEERALDRCLGAEGPPRFRVDGSCGAVLSAGALLGLAPRLSGAESGTVLGLSTSPYGEHHGVLLRVNGGAPG